jgi:hypothetical protein
MVILRRKDMVVAPASGTNGFMNRSIVVLLLFVGTISHLMAAPRRLPAYLPEKSAPVAYGDEWRDFKSTTKDLSKTLGMKNPEAASLLAQIQTNALFLETKWNDWFKAHSRSQQYAKGDDYLRSLQRANRLLDRTGKEKDEQKALATLRDVALDLQIKTDNCRHSSDGLGKEIKVKVHTKAGGKEIGGYEVYFVQKGMFDVKSAHDRFPQQSSPTNEKILTPGGYAMWVRKKAFMGEPVTMRIGGHGETHLEVDLEVPSD